MIGQTLGNYRLLDKIGEGGMGVVYKAEHVLIGRKAALKLLSRALSQNEQMVTRFFNEARATSLIEHPGLVDVSDFGYHEGQAFIVMEYLQGETLAARIHRERRLQLDVFASIVRQIAAALGAAHAKGIIHRDLKPDNVFLIADREVASGLRVKVLDFGIAKLMDDAGPSQAHTHTGAVLGTPRYMSPEQCKGTGHVDYRADVYSLGCMMFEMVIGVPPFDRSGTGELIAAHIYEPPPHPSQFDPSVPPQLDQLIVWCLQKDANARPRSMGEVEQSLEGWAPRMTAAQRAQTPPPGGYGTGWPTPMPSQGGYTPSHPGHTPVPRAPSHGGYTPVPHAQAPMPYAPTYASMPGQGPGQTHGGPTTHSGAAGQSMVANPPPRGRGKVIAIVAGVVLAAGAAVVVAIGAGGGGGAGAANPGVAANDPGAAPASGAEAAVAVTPTAPPAAPTAPEIVPSLAAPAAEVTVRVTSDPPGADVYRAFDGIRVGQTPLEQKLPRMDADAVLVLRKRGFKDARVEIHLDADALREITLEKSSSSGGGGTIAMPTPPKQPPPTEGAPTLVVTAPRPPTPAPIAPAPTPAPVTPSIAPPAPPPPKPIPPPPPPKAKVVVPSAMTKLSGKNPSGDGNVTAKLCVDDGGRVTSVNILQAPGGVKDAAASALKQWRYKPYVEGGRAIPVCFAVNLKL